MDDLLQGIITELAQLGEDLVKNEGRPSAQELINRIGRLSAMALTLQQNLQILPPAEPYKMDTPTIDKIEAAINEHKRISIEPDGSVMVYPAGYSDQALAEAHESLREPPPAPEVREPQTITADDVGQMPASVAADDDV